MIAYLVHRFPVGTQTFTYDELCGLRQAGLPLAVYSFRPGEKLGWPLEGIEVRQLPGPWSSRYALALAWWAVRRPLRLARTLGWVLGGRFLHRPTSRERLSGLFALPRAALLAREPGLSMFHAQFANEAATVALVAGLLADVPFSFRSHTAPNPQLLGLKLRRAAVVLSISEYDRDQLRAVEPGANIVLSPLGIPLPEPAAVDREPGLVVSVGSLIEKKGHDVLIDACARLVGAGRAIRCEIVGDGHLAGLLGRRIARAGLADRVVLRGYLPREEVEALVGRAAVFALASVPSAAGVDGVPVALIEALALGTPCVGSRLSGIPEVVRDGETGLLVPPGDAVALAGAIARLLDDAELAGRLAGAGRALVRSERSADGCYRLAAEAIASALAAAGAAALT